MMGMWKKLLIALIALTGTFTVGYAYYNLNLNAAGTKYQVPANATVKLGEKGLFPNGHSGDMAKGDKVYIGSDNPNTGTPLSFMLLVKETYNTYLPVFDSSDNVTLDTTQPYVTGWFAMGNESIKETSFFSSFPPIVHVGGSYYGVKNFLTTEPTSLIISELENANQSISIKTQNLLLPRNLDYLNQLTIAGISVKNPVMTHLYKENMRHSLKFFKKYFIIQL